MAEAELKSLDRYRLLMANINDLAYICDCDGNVLYVSQVFETLSGRRIDEFIGESFAPLFDEHNLPIARKNYQATLDGESPQFEVRFKETGTLCEYKNIPLRDTENGAIIGVMGIARDITKRKQAEEELERIFNVSPDMICIANADGYFERLNPAWEAVLGYTIEELLASPFLDFVHPDDRSATLAEVAEQLAGRATIRFENRYRCKDGTYKTLEWRATPACRGELYAVARDITARKQAEENRRLLDQQLQHAQKLESLGVLAGGIAHDFNNILMTVLGNAELALSELGPNSGSRVYLNEISHASRRAAELCRQMLAYSGRGSFELKALDLSAEIEDMSRMMQVSISKTAQIRHNFAVELPAIVADPSQMHQIIMNLITNASEAIGQASGVIQISTGTETCGREELERYYLAESLPEGRYVYVEVADTGCGMKPEVLERIFEPFFTTRFTGRGLGLAAVLGIVRGHRGGLRVESEPGSGTTFRVIFPAVEEPASRSDALEASDAAYSGVGTVLVADDEEFVLTVTGQMLERVGFEVITATNGREALDLYHRHAQQIVCVVLDLTMPEMDGREAFRRLRLQNPDLPIIVSSGYGTQDVAQKFRESGNACFIQKPFTLDTLRAALSEVLGNQPELGQATR